MNALTTIIRKLPAWVWVLLAFALLVLLFRGPLKRTFVSVGRFFRRDGGDYSQGFTDGLGQEVSGDDKEARKKEIEALVQEVHTRLHQMPTNPVAREAALEALLALNDTELRYAAQRYDLVSRDETLYAAVHAEWMPFSTVDERLLARLANLGMT